jgi:hypothetical protein
MFTPPFNVSQFFAVFADYNAAIWPLQIVAYAMGILAVIALWSREPSAKPMILVVLALLWAVNGIGYHALFFAKINPIAEVFAALFVLQALLFVACALRQNDFYFELRHDFRSAIGLSFIVYALLIYELIGYWAGHGLMAGPLFGVSPCPTTIFTIGLLLLARGRSVIWLAIIPLLWSLIGLSAASQFDVQEDLALPIAGAMLVIVMATERIFGRAFQPLSPRP